MDREKRTENGADSRAKGRLRPVSHAEIARVAGVSPGLVSAYLSGNHYSSERKHGIGISQAKRRKIKDTCLKLQFVPDNPFAFYRIYPEKADVGFLLNEKVMDGFSNPYHSLIFEGFARAAFEAEVDLCNVFYRSETDYVVDPETLPNPLLKGTVNKVAITGLPPNYSLVHQLLRMERCVVFVGQSLPVDGVVSVVPDFKSAARQAVEILHAMGHRNIVAAHPSTSRKNLYNGKLMREGFLSACADLNLEIGDAHILGFEPHFNAEALLAELRGFNPLPTALYCLDDSFARSVAHALRGAGYSIPRDISILSTNDDRINQEARPALSTMHIPCREMGECAFRELNRIAAEGRPAQAECQMLPVHYVDRGTVAPPRREAVVGTLLPA